MAVEKVKITVEIVTEYGTLTAESEVDGLLVRQAAVPRRYLLNHFNGMLVVIEKEVNADEGVGG